MWVPAGVIGALVVLTGALSPQEARGVAVTRGGPVLGFLVAITVLAELAEREGVFAAAARGCARLARGSTPLLFLLVALLGVLVTAGMSLDTTAVLLTPVVLNLTAALGLRSEPFALLAVWLANTASLVLPGANLTNLLAGQRAQLPASGFAARMALPELAAVTVSVGYLAVVFRRDLAGRYPAPVREQPGDRIAFRVCALACLALAPGILLGAPPWAVAAGCALAAVIVVAVRDPAALAWSLVPWRIVVLTEGLLLAVSALAAHGGSELLAHLAGTSPLRTAVTAAAASNAVNNLPAYLAVESAVPPGHTTQLLAALVGTNAGPLITVWGSLATLLWRERCRASGVVISPWRFALIGLGGVPLVVLAAWAALLV